MLFSEIPLIHKAASVINFVTDYECKVIATDSRKIEVHDGVFFFALKGMRHDGHNYLNEVINAGIKTIIVEKVPVDIPIGINVICVDDTLSLIQSMARHRRMRFSKPVIAITGSNAKTVVKEQLASLLSEHYFISKSPGSFNSQLGVALSLWQISASSNLAIIEAGISLPQEMEKLEKMIKPSIGVLTNLGTAHDAGFRSKKEKLEEKLKLFINVDQLVYRYDHQLIQEYILNHPLKGTVYGWSTKNPNADIYFESVNDGWKVHFQDRVFLVSPDVTDAALLENLFHCISVMLLLNLSDQDIQKESKINIKVDRRLTLKKGIRNSYLIDDTYNNDISGLRASLQFMAQQPMKNNRVVILSDILQSGKNEKELYHEVNDLLKSHHVKALIAIGPSIKRSTSSFDLPTSYYETTEEFLNAHRTFPESLVLIKGARQFRFENIVSRLEHQQHGTVLSVNLESLVHNLNYYKGMCHPNTKLMVMVKAFAYGGGALEIAHQLQYQKVDYLGVAYLDEGVTLREAGIHLPIMVMNPDPEAFEIMLTHKLEPEIYSFEILDKLRYFTRRGNELPCHLKINTGMNRLGFDVNEIDTLVNALDSAIQVKSIFSHLSSSDDRQQREFTLEQIDKFNIAYQKISSKLAYSPIKHILNSSGIMNFPAYEFDMVRLGVGLYGFDSTSTHQPALRTVSKLTTVIAQIRHVKKGTTIGYARKGLAKEDMSIAIINIGYADGYSRAFSNGVGRVLAGGKLVPVIGNVCMDMTMIDVTDLNVNAGDQVTVFGEKPSIMELASSINTIPYEILTNVSERVKREFVYG